LFLSKEVPVSKKKRNMSLGLIVVASILSVVWIGCGSSGSSSNNLSQAQAQAVVGQLSQALVMALQSAFLVSAPATSARPSLSTVIKDIRPDQATVCTPTVNGENCDWPVSYSGPCPAGGTISVTGDIDGTLDNSGGGSVQTQLVITPANCSVSNLVINGDPSVSVDGQIGFATDAPVFPITMTESGGLSYGPHPAGSCKFDVTYTINSETSCTISGTACGQPVSGSC
jgi:hypothetical protein